MDMPAAQLWDPALDSLDQRRIYPDHDAHRRLHHQHHHHQNQDYTHDLHQAQMHAQTHPQTQPRTTQHHQEASISPPQTQSRMRRGSGEPAKQLACSNCRKKKIKCQPNVDGGRCRACLRSGAECLVPAVDERKLSNSKKLVRELYARIASLEAELQGHCEAGGGPQTLSALCEPRRDSFRHIVGFASSSDDNDDDDGGDDGGDGDGDSDTMPPYARVEAMHGVALSPSSNISDLSGHFGSGILASTIIRLCGGHRDLKSDRMSRLHCCGPSSSLHPEKNMASSKLVRQPATSHSRGTQWQNTVPSAVQDYLFELYWKYQHQVIPIIHKDAFLQDYKSGLTNYCSRLLVHCVLARAAAISDRPDIRAMALSGDEAGDGTPLLVRRCAELLDAELNQKPGITTLQSLQLLSEIYCVVGSNTRGWMDAGRASRLASELCLQQDTTTASAVAASHVEQEVRQLCLWSCFSLDRQWALCLGRPQMIKLDDVSVRISNSRSTTHESSTDLRISAAWADLLEIVGTLCEALSGIQTKRHRIAALDRSLRDWYTHLEANFRYNPQQIPAVFQLHMQYSAAVILLHRPLAQFGTAADEPPSHRSEYDPYDQHYETRTSSPRETSRQLCVQHACLVAQYIQQYEECHGSLHTLSWVTLHMICVAATTLIATLSEGCDASNTSYLLSSLQTCMRALGDLEQSHLPTRRARALILRAMHLLNLESKLNKRPVMPQSSPSAASSSSTVSSASSGPVVIPIHTSTGSWAPASLDMPIGGIWGGEAHSTVQAESATFAEFLPLGSFASQAELLTSLESLLC